MGKLITKILALVLSLLLLAGCTNSQKLTDGQIFTDSLGRQVTIPQQIERVAPTGSLAQIFIYTLCPEKLAGLSSPVSERQKKYFLPQMQDLPVWGQLYAGGGSLNLEALMATKPDLIIDVGEKKESGREDLDNLQEQTGIPVIFIEAGLADIPSAYTTLGKILACSEQAAKLSAYGQRVLEETALKLEQIPTEERVRVLYTGGEYGQEVNSRGSSHAEVLEYAGLINVAELEQISGSGGTEVSLEQIVLWQPEAIVFKPYSIYKDLPEVDIWRDLEAIKNQQYFEVPNEPYNWLNEPPSVQRLLGMQWLDQLFYPQYFGGDFAATVQEFYQLFFHYQLSSAEVQEILDN